eukprot:2488334-Prymnesium_polylepis.1
MRSHCQPRPRTRANNGQASNTPTHSTTTHVHVLNKTIPWLDARENAANRGHSCVSGCVAASPLHTTYGASERHGAHCGA